MEPLTDKTALITGGVKRLGAAVARALHEAGMNLVLHYRSSETDAQTLRDELNQQRPDSVLLLRADLQHTARLPPLVERAAARWGRLDLLVNNASGFYPTPIGATTEAHWDELMGSNLKGPFFLAQAAAPHLHKTQGTIINIVDIYAYHPLARHTVYSTAKAGLVMLTRSLARELGPSVRVNGIAPGAILWPEQGVEEEEKTRLLERVALRRVGDPSDIARTLLFLARDAGYISGQIITVDGGRTVFS